MTVHKKQRQQRHKLGSKGRVASKQSASASRNPADYANARVQQLERVLVEVLKLKHPADMVLSHWFRENRYLGSRDRAEISEAVFDV